MFYIMVMNKDISSILLLVIIGFTIYCLCNDKPKNRPRKREHLADVAPTTTEESEVVLSKSETPTQTPTQTPAEKAEPQESETPASETPASVQNLSEVSSNATVSDADIDEILKEKKTANLI